MTGISEGIEYAPSEEAFYRMLQIRLASVGLQLSEIEEYLSPTLLVTQRRLASTSPNQKLRGASDGSVRLSVTHFSSQCLFLYQLARQAWLSGDRTVAEQIYLLNVSTSSCDIHYEIELPLHTGCEHPLGSVVGRAEFTSRSRVFFYNSCVIGGSYVDADERAYPRIDGSIVLYPHSSLVGRINVRGTVIVGHGVKLVNVGDLEDEVISISDGRTNRRRIDERDHVLHGKFA